MVREPHAKFFVNQGLVTSRADIAALLAPIVKTAVTYRYVRGRELVTFGIGWVERVTEGEPGVSSIFTPLTIVINAASFEHLEFETRADQQLVYTLVQGDERVVLEPVPADEADAVAVVAERRRAAGEADGMDADGYVQMELGGFDEPETAGPDA